MEVSEVQNHSSRTSPQYGEYGEKTMELFGMREMACMIGLQGDMTCMDAIVVL